MISIDKAKKLKELGLKWEPYKGDFYLPEKTEEMPDWMQDVWPEWTQKPCLVGVSYHYEELDYQYFDFDHGEFFVKKEVTWLPKLDQLLSEIEKLGYNPKLEKWDDEMYECDPCIDGISNRKNAVIGKSWEDVIAELLIRLMETQHKS